MITAITDIRLDFFVVQALFDPAQISSDSLDGLLNGLALQVDLKTGAAFVALFGKLGDDLLKGPQLLMLARVVLILPLVEVLVPGISSHLYEESVPFIEFPVTTFGFNLGCPCLRGCRSLYSCS